MILLKNNANEKITYEPETTVVFKIANCFVIFEGQVMARIRNLAFSFCLYLNTVQSWEKKKKRY